MHFFCDVFSFKRLKFSYLQNQKNERKTQCILLEFLYLLLIFFLPELKPDLTIGMDLAEHPFPER